MDGTATGSFACRRSSDGAAGRTGVWAGTVFCITRVIVDASSGGVFELGLVNRAVTEVAATKAPRCGPTGRRAGHVYASACAARRTGRLIGIALIRPEAGSSIDIAC